MGCCRFCFGRAARGCERLKGAMHFFGAGFLHVVILGGTGTLEASAGLFDLSSRGQS
jgi:hypothetical protein